MKKAQTMIEAHDGKKKINEGDLVICIQANKDSNGFMVNMDWSFAKGTTNTEIKSVIGGFLGNIEDLFGEKMVTESVMHYADENGHIVDTPHGKAMHLKSKGIGFKDWKAGDK